MYIKHRINELLPYMMRLDLPTRAFDDLYGLDFTRRFLMRHHVANQGPWMQLANRFERWGKRHGVEINL